MFDRYLRRVSTLKLDADRCTGCRTCTTVCPHGVLLMEDKKASIADLDACMECSACVMNCPEGALQVRRGVGCASSVISTALGLNDKSCC